MKSTPEMIREKTYKNTNKTDALKEQKNNIIKDLEEIYNDLHFFDKTTIYNPEEQAEEIQMKIRKLIVKIKYI